MIHSKIPVDRYITANGDCYWELTHDSGLWCRTQKGNIYFEFLQVLKNKSNIKFALSKIIVRAKNPQGFLNTIQIK